MSELKSVVATVRKGAKYKRTYPEDWRRNECKKKRVLGEAYSSLRTGNVVPCKNFALVKKCCSKNCHLKFKRTDQKELFDVFYGLQSKATQDQFLSNCLHKFVAPARPRLNVDPKRDRLHIWKYSVKFKGEDIETCRSFILQLLQISEKRIRIIQEKTAVGDSFQEKRGKHGKQRKLEGVYKLALEHLKSIPHHTSHYTSKNRSNRLYFDNPNLTGKAIFDEFKSFYHSRSGSLLNMKLKTYLNFYSQSSYTTKKPKTDTCDFCCESQQKLKRNPTDRKTKVELELHQRKSRKHDEMKRNFIELAKTSKEILVCEFDYAQNLPLPKLTICKQFYKRLLWLYVFNIHCHNDDSSFVYTFIESTAKKGPNSVSSFLFDFLQKKIGEFPNLKKIVLLSDAAAGQNKNSTMVKFCSYLSYTYCVTVLQIYPVRGHSFGQCDRNFGLIRSKLKRMEVIETPEPYFEAIKTARTKPSPFELINDPSLMLEWDKALSPFFYKNPSSKGAKFGIQQYCQLLYSSSGVVAAGRTYESDMFQLFKFRKSKPSEIILEPSPKVPIKTGNKGEGKIQDIQDLYRYLKGESIHFFEALFDSAGCTVSEQAPTPENGQGAANEKPGSNG